MIMRKWDLKPNILDKKIIDYRTALSTKLKGIFLIIHGVLI